MGASEQYCIRWNNHQRNFMTVMDDLLENETLADVTLGTDDGRIIKCHKIVLATCSTYFHSLLIGVSCKHPIILFKDVKYTEIKAILEFMYKGEVSVAHDEMFDLLKVAELLKVKGLVNGDHSLSSEMTSTPMNYHTDRDDRVDAQQAHASSESLHRNPIPHWRGSPPSTTVDESPSELHSADTKYPGPEWSHDSNVEDDKSSMPFMNFHPAYLLAQSLPRYHNPDNDPETSTARDKKDKISGISAKKRRRSQTTRIAHNQGEDDGSVRLPIIRQHSDDSHYRNRIDGSANNNSDDNIRKSMAISHHNRHRLHSPCETDALMMDDDEKRAQSFSEDPRSGIPDCVTAQRDKGKRYKKYSRNDMRSAIDAVKGGLSANKAAELFNVPSRTLYDKIKKLGIASMKNRRGENVSGSPSAAFPYAELTGNANIDVNSDIADNDFDEADKNEMMEDPTMIVESTLADTRDADSIDREGIIDRRSPIFRPVPIDSSQGKTSSFRGDANQAEDLSVSRKPSNVPVIVSPNITIKEEII